MKRKISIRIKFSHSNPAYTPERYVEEDYDYVYAIAVTFSQKTVNELEEKEEE